MTLTILQRIAKGDEKAIAECMEHYGGLVWSLARRWCNNPSDAEDATQEIFLNIWKSAARYKPEAGSESVFIATIARRRLIDRLRAQERRPETEEYVDESSMVADRDDDAMRATEASIAARAVSQLAASQREILLMGVVHGMSHSEIAAATGKPLGTVKTQMRRGLIRVRELIEQGDGAKSRSDAEDDET